MPRFSIDIDGDTAGHIAWKLHADHSSDGDNDADCKELINVIKKLNDFTLQLEATSPIEE